MVALWLLACRDAMVADTPEAGATCGSLSDGGVTCARSEATMLVCQEGTYAEVRACPDGSTCWASPDQDLVACMDGDWALPLALEGNGCATAGAAACDPDQIEVLECDAEVWTRVEACDEGQVCDHVDAGYVDADGTTCNAEATGGCMVCVSS